MCNSCSNTTTKKDFLCEKRISFFTVPGSTTNIGITFDGITETIDLKQTVVNAESQTVIRFNEGENRIEYLSEEYFRKGKDPSFIQYIGLDRLSTIITSLVQEGQTAEGRYVRLPGGTQICYGTVTALKTAGYDTGNRMNAVWKFPKPFFQPPTVTVGLPVNNEVNFVNLNGSSGGRENIKSYGPSTPDKKTTTVTIWAEPGTVEEDSEIHNIQIQAIGRWK